MFTQVIIRKRKTDGRTYDGRTDGLTDDQRETIIPRHYCMAGYKNRLSRHYWGCLCSLANYSVAYKETQSNRDSDFRDFVCALFPKAIPVLLLFYSTLDGVVPCGGRKKVSPYIIIVQDIIFYFFGIIEPILVILQIEYRLSRRKGVRMQHRKPQFCI